MQQEKHTSWQAARTTKRRARSHTSLSVASSSDRPRAPPPSLVPPPPPSGGPVRRLPPPTPSCSLACASACRLWPHAYNDDLAVRPRRPGQPSASPPAAPTRLAATCVARTTNRRMCSTADQNNGPAWAIERLHDQIQVTTVSHTPTSRELTRNLYVLKFES